MQEYFATANREKMRRPYPRRDPGPAAKPLAERRRREEDAASGAKLEMARCKNKLNRAGTVGGAAAHPALLSVMSSGVETSLTILRGSPAPDSSSVDESCNQCHFLCSRPFLELLFPCNGVADVCAVLVVDQFLTA